MLHPDPRLVTPLYVKRDDELDWPEGPGAFYVLSSSGLFLCRNHEFFRSSVAARIWPSELARHQPFLELACPKVPRGQLELIVGFFHCVAHRHQAEAAVLLLWDRKRERVRFFVPRQEATVRQSWGGARYGVDVRYEVPRLPAHLALIGDVHSHVDGAAYASGVDRADEAHSAGLHVVVGRIFSDRPEFHCDWVVDGKRFAADPSEVLEGFERRRTDIPAGWVEKVRIRIERAYGSDASDGRSDGDDTAWRS